jgi:hypothetical protein
MISNGLPTQNAQRIQEESAREVARQQIWLSEACPPDGGTPREEQRKATRIIKVENATRIDKPFCLEADTTQEIEVFFQQIYGVQTSFIGLLFSPSASGAMHRKYIEGKIDPSVDTVYVKLYLKKHHPIHREIA